MFEKPESKLATYLPLGISKSAKISANTHWQIDYIMTRRNNIRIEDCETDTKAQLQSDHYPVIAQMKIKFKKQSSKPEQIKTYNKKSVWKNKESLYNALAEWRYYNDMIEYSQWTKAYEHTVK